MRLPCGPRACGSRGCAVTAVSAPVCIIAHVKTANQTRAFGTHDSSEAACRTVRASARPTHDHPLHTDELGDGALRRPHLRCAFDRTTCYQPRGPISCSVSDPTILHLLYGHAFQGQRHTHQRLREHINLGSMRVHRLKHSRAVAHIPYPDFSASERPWPKRSTTPAGSNPS